MSAGVEEKRPVMGKALRKFIARVVRLTLRDELGQLGDKLLEGYWDRWLQLRVKFRNQKLLIKVEHYVDRCDTSENFDGTQRIDPGARYFEVIHVSRDDEARILVPDKDKDFATRTGAYELWKFLENAREQGRISR